MDSIRHIRYIHGPIYSPPEHNQGAVGRGLNPNALPSPHPHRPPSPSSADKTLRQEIHGAVNKSAYDFNNDYSTAIDNYVDSPRETGM